MIINWDEAPEWADRAVGWMNNIVLFSDGVSFLNTRGDKVLHCAVTDCDDKGEALDWWCELGDTKLIEMRPNKWQEGEERMNNIAQNGNDGHYSETPKPDVIEHGNNNKYSRKIKTIVVDGIDHDIYVDVYDVLTAFKTTNPANDHAIKKQLATGQRGVKGVIQDLTEARDSLSRAIEIEKAK